jgi:hypothetical protein
MKITIDVPEMTCAKCNATAPIQPSFLYVKGAIPPQFREMFTAIVKARADVHADDDTGRTWEAYTHEQPVGWTKGPAQSDLCATCTALWTEAGKAFLVPAEVPAAEPEAEPLPAVPQVQSSAQRPLTMSEILAKKNYDNAQQHTNSLMPMEMPASLRR